MVRQVWFSLLCVLAVHLCCCQLHCHFCRLGRLLLFLAEVIVVYLVSFNYWIQILNKTCMYITPASIILFKYILSFCWLYLLFSAYSIHSFLLILFTLFCLFYSLFSAYSTHSFSTYPFSCYFPSATLYPPHFNTSYSPSLASLPLVTTFLLPLFSLLLSYVCTHCISVAVMWLIISCLQICK